MSGKNKKRSGQVKTKKTKKTKEVKTPKEVKTKEVKEVSQSDREKSNVFDIDCILPKSLGLSLGKRQVSAYLSNQTEIDKEFNERGQELESQLCNIGETDLIDSGLKKIMSLIIAKYIETVSGKVWSVSDFESLDRQTLRDYIETCQSFYNVSFSQVLQDLKTLRELRERESVNRSFLKTLLTHFLGDFQSVPKKNIDSGKSFSEVWSESVKIMSQ